MKEIFYNWRIGKPNRLLYYTRKFAGLLVPKFFYRMRLKKKLASLEKRPDKAYIEERVDYYNRLDKITLLPATDGIRKVHGGREFIGNMNGFKYKTFHSSYYFDSVEYTRWFNKNYRWVYYPGDIEFLLEMPGVVKCRMLRDDNRNSVIMKLDKFRHFIFLNDRKPFAEKKNMAIFMGKIRNNPTRTKFMEMFFGNPMVTCGVTTKEFEETPPEWVLKKKTFREHLDYKFIMSLEGNDVASNLKWVMSSNSIAVSPKLTFETWFMEGKLIADYHYIEVKPDFSDLIEKLTYYSEHPDKAQEIIDHAHEYIAQFKDSKREDLISLLVLDKYFKKTGQQF